MDWRRGEVRSALHKLVADQRTTGGETFDIIVWHANGLTSILETVATNFHPEVMDIPYGEGLVSECLKGKTVDRRDLR